MHNNVFNNKQLGSSMLEILVAIFILSVGLLGLASLQIASIKNINNAQFHSLATEYAYDMAERMRSNRAAVTSGAYDNIVSTVTDPGCTVCSTSGMAQFDGYQWNQKIQSDVKTGGLPEGIGTVIKNGNVFNITIAWKEQQRSNTGGRVGDASFTLNVQI